MVEISVIIPIYNKGKYLKNLWNNLLKQSFKNYECLLIDDGSTDSSGNLCDQIGEKDSRFRVFHIENGGVSNARNLGLDYAKGKFVTFIDADDGLHEDYLKNLYECITKNSVDFVVSSITKVWKNIDKIEIIKTPYYGLCSREKYMESFVKNQLKNGIYGFCVSKIMTRKLIGDHRFKKEIKLAEDLEFYLSLYSQIDKIYFDNKPYYYYLQEAENSSMQLDDYQIDYYIQLKILYKMYLMLEEIHYLTGENKNLIKNRMCDYIFFTLFHACKSEMKNYCKLIRKLNIEVVDLKNRNFLQKIVLGMFKHNKDILLIGFLRLYRLVRRINY